MVSIRDGPIPEFSKDLKASTNKRVFNFDLSVFATWKKDDDVIIDEALRHD